MAYGRLQSIPPAMFCALALCAGTSAQADGFAPSKVFLQAGYGDQRTDAYLVGLSWQLPLQYDFRAGFLGVTAEAALGRWHTQGQRAGTAWPTQISATPTLRFYPSKMPSWFIEAGVGANYIVPLFRSGYKRFSTEFNFGDHVAVGHAFGHSELSLRVEHFSNAGISHPNPGENFAQVRYAYRF